ncbi:insulinase family protein [Deinococcus sp. KNUC1210]|uniref:M16 family metallopeptidase n=1 Tax=Deinococcus sp. KNUC1210 TaxID=2917691 RepID=UPI001EF15E1D|nr:pitrilysin family protein [Deinococcus sp. KNUC1210]ULH15142.1 insulinase family protein [Deinococcus sp. KNUC1210]
MSAPTPNAPTLHTLSSGLRVLLAPDEQAQTVAMGYFVRTGARDEHRSEMGASHFLEHLMFKGSEEVSSAELNARLDALSGSANAFTSDEATVYHAASLPEQAAELLDTLSVLMRPALRSAETETERGVILEEIAMYADQPESRVFDALRSSYWGEHALGHQVLGTGQTVAALTPEVLRRNFEERYGTPSITLVVCGQFVAAAVLEQAKRLSADWPRTPFERRLAPHTPTAGLRVLPDAALSRVHVALAMPGIPVGHPLREAAAVLSEIVGGENGRLYWALLDTGLADGADLGHAEYQETGVFEGGFSCDPARAGAALEVFRSTLRAVQTQGVTAAEVRRAARKLAVSTLLRAETPQGQLFGLGMEFLALGRVVEVGEAVERVANVTPDDVAALLALRPFDLQVTVALGQPDALEALAQPG